MLISLCRFSSTWIKKEKNTSYQQNYECVYFWRTNVYRIESRVWRDNESILVSVVLIEGSSNLGLVSNLIFFNEESFNWFRIACYKFVTLVTSLLHSLQACYAVIHVLRSLQACYACYKELSRLKTDEPLTRSFLSLLVFSEWPIQNVDQVREMSIL